MGILIILCINYVTIRTERTKIVLLCAFVGKCSKYLMAILSYIKASTNAKLHCAFRFGGDAMTCDIGGGGGSG